MSLPANAIIATVSIITAALSMAAGHLAASLFDTGLASYMGAGAMALIGLWISLKAFLDGFAPPAHGMPREICSVRFSSPGLILRILKEPLWADMDQSGTIDLREASLLGLALALNCIANGIPAGLMGLPIVLTSVNVGLFSFLSIWLGWRLGHLAGSRMISQRAGILSGVILLCLAAYEAVAK